LLWTASHEVIDRLQGQTARASDATVNMKSLRKGLEKNFQSRTGKKQTWKSKAQFFTETETIYFMDQELISILFQENKLKDAANT